MSAFIEDVVESRHQQPNEEGTFASRKKLSASELSRITDPVEFEKAWKRIFGRKSR